jgi:hypothetical protein
MAIQIQLRKGTATEHNTFTGADGEVTVDTTNKTLRVHDGSTVGGTRLATLTGGLVPAAQLPAATTSTQGAVILNNTVTSSSIYDALTAAQGKVLNDQAFGVGQSWQDVKASRALGTTYTNTTGKPIYVIVVNEFYDYGDPVEVFVNNIKLLSVDKGVGVGWLGDTSFVVPAGQTYKVTKVAYPNIQSWVELR